jgi:hypothetical protein
MPKSADQVKAPMAAKKELSYIYITDVPCPQRNTIVLVVKALC